MRRGLARSLTVAAAGLWLAGCGVTTGSLSETLGLSKSPQSADQAASAHAEVSPLGPDAADPGLLGANPYDDLSIGKRYYRAGNYGMAERYFRKAVETHPRDAEAWLDLAAACDRLRRFDLADRAYAEAVGIAGPTVEILNNQGYSYMLRGDYARARVKLDEAHRRAPGNKFVENNLRLLDASLREKKQVE
jgi:Flp pilus assembly protein TadD